MGRNAGVDESSRWLTIILNTSLIVTCWLAKVFFSVDLENFKIIAYQLKGSFYPSTLDKRRKRCDKSVTKKIVSSEPVKHVLSFFINCTWVELMVFITITTSCTMLHTAGAIMHNSRHDTPCFFRRLNAIFRQPATPQWAFSGHENNRLREFLDGNFTRWLHASFSS